MLYLFYSNILKINFIFTFTSSHKERKKKKITTSLGDTLKQEPVVCWNISLAIVSIISSRNKQLQRLTARYHMYVRILWVPHVFHSAITTRIDEERGARTGYHYYGHSAGGWYWHHHYVRVHYRANVANPNRRVSPS